MMWEKRDIQDLDDFERQIEEKGDHTLYVVYPTQGLFDVFVGDGETVRHDVHNQTMGTYIYG